MKCGRVAMMTSVTHQCNAVISFTHLTFIYLFVCYPFVWVSQRVDVVSS